ncbi:MAG: NYN domain-containing protein, partial [bacterium]|nr:NYN domain-containing protein [bacterium]
LQLHRTTLLTPVTHSTRSQRVLRSLSGTARQIGLFGVVRTGILMPYFPACPAQQGMAGLFFSGAVSITKVVVFIDYQNVYHRARASFGYDGDPDPNIGHIYPQKVGELLCDLGLPNDPYRELNEVRVYKGMPDHRSGVDAQSFAARQIAAWENAPTVMVRYRPLDYFEVEKKGKTVWKSQEKGVDVMLALDLVDLAQSGVFDTAVVFSADSDLLPALEQVVDLGRRVETATWDGPGINRGPLRIPECDLWNHRLNRSHFDQVCDSTDYLATE